MRYPLSITVPSCLVVISLSWWLGTRHKNFMQPPDAATLEQIRIRAQQAFPVPYQADDAVSSPADSRSPGSTQDRPISLRPEELTRPPTLADFRNHAKAGTQRLIELAQSLERSGDPQRALIAWERVIDSTKPDEAQAKAAIQRIQILRQQLPVWNPNPEDATPIVLHAGTGARTAKQIQSLLEESARNLEIASSGILKVNAEIAAGVDDLAASGSTPVALWLSGPGEATRSTYIGSISVDANGKPDEDLNHSLFRILRGYVDRELALTPPIAPENSVSIADAFKHHITRHAWQELGKTLNLAP